MTKDEALNRALATFEKVKNDADKQPPVYPWDAWRLWVDDALTAIKEALAQPEQEPIGYASEGAAERLTTVKQTHEQIRSFRLFTHDVPLYTTPPQQDGECKHCTDGCPACDARKLPEQKPVQVSPLEFVEMVMEKEHLVGKPIFWAEWPNKEKNT